MTDITSVDIDGLREPLEQEAEEQDRSNGWIIRAALREYLEVDE